VHAAVVTSLATTAFLLDGPQSHLFGLTAIFAAVVMYDSFGVRRSAGEQAAALNMVIDSLTSGRVSLHKPDLKLREVLGHTPLEVAVGSAIGLLLGCLFNAQKLQAQFAWLTAQPLNLEMIIYGAVAGVLVVGGWATKFWLHRRYPRSQIMREFSKKLLTKTQAIGWTGLVLALGQYEGVPYLDWRLWSILLFVALLAWDAYLVKRYWQTIPEHLRLEAEAAERRKWLSLPKRKKRRK
jgi:hypothetical protein